MPISRVQSALANGSGIPSVTLPGASTSGNFLLYYHVFLGPSVAIIDSPVYNAASAGTGAGQSYINGLSFELYSTYFRNITGTGTATVSGPTPSAGTPNWMAGLIEYSGVKTTDPIYDRFASLTFNAASPQNSTATLATNQASEVAVGSSVLMSSAFQAVPGAPYNSIGTTTSIAGGATLTLADLILSAIGTQIYGITYASSVIGGVGVATFRAQDSGRVNFLPLLGVS